MSRRILWAVLILVLGGVMVAWLATSMRPETSSDTARGGPLDSFGAVPDFSLTDQLGRPTTRADLDGRPWVADFIFTRCGGPCPRMSERMARMANALGPDSTVRFVSFTVDPDYDTPAVLREYATALGADSDRWRFLTGSRAEILRVSIDGFHLAMGDAEIDSATALMNVAHSTRFVLVDGAGIIRGYYDGEDETARAGLDRDINVLTGDHR